jgi:two-component system, OmpR family, catabolic regulation response regulator CreB
MAGARILLVEDDPAIARSIIYTLERDGLSVTHSLLLGDARRQLALQLPDAVILDVGLPDGSGFDLCRELRAAGSLPVLMLSAQGEEIDRVLGLELGADDYVSKPFSPRELLARVRSLLRRARMPAPAAAPAGASPFVIDTAGQRANLHGLPLNLTRREFGLLAELLRHRERIRSRDELLTAVWGTDSDSTDRTVDTHIKTLRAKLQEAAPEHDYIVTHRGMGYSLDINRTKGS